MAEDDDHIHELCLVDDRYSLVIYGQFTLSKLTRKPISTRAESLLRLPAVLISDQVPFRFQADQFLYGTGILGFW